jgi:hypothetical protein
MTVVTVAYLALFSNVLQQKGKSQIHRNSLPAPPSVPLGYKKHPLKAVGLVI